MNSTSAISASSLFAVGAGAATTGAGGCRLGEAEVEIEEEVGQKEQGGPGAEEFRSFHPILSLPQPS